MRRVWLFTLVLVTLCIQMTSALAYAWWKYGDPIPFHDRNFNITGVVSDTDGHPEADNLWVGTIEDPILGVAYLCSETNVNGGLTFWGNAGYKDDSYNSTLALKPSPACTFPPGKWEVTFHNGVPYLNCDDQYIQKMQVAVNRGRFSIPVRDQFGKPVVGAVFSISGVTWGGNGDKSFGQVTTDQSGMLVFPMELIADRAYWFEQVTAPAGYLPMKEKLYEVKIGFQGGFAAMVADYDHFQPQTIREVINKTDDGKLNTASPAANGSNPDSAYTPPKTGDSSHIGLLGASAGAAFCCMGAIVYSLMKKCKKI